MEGMKSIQELIPSFEKLKLYEAKELYKKMDSTDNIEDRKKIRERIILGTLYFLRRELLEKSEIQYLRTMYDLDDIMSEFIESWIKKIDSGYLMTVQSFVQMIDYKAVTNRITKGKLNRYVQEKFPEIETKKEFSEILLKYINLRKNKFKVTKEEMNVSDELLNFLESIYKGLDIEDKEIDITSNDILNYFNLFIENTLDNSTRESFHSTTMEYESYILNNIESGEIKKDISDMFSKEGVTKERFGLSREELVNKIFMNHYNRIYKLIRIYQIYSKSCDKQGIEKDFKKEIMDNCKKYSDLDSYTSKYYTDIYDRLLSKKGDTTIKKFLNKNLLKKITIVDEKLVLDDSMKSEDPELYNDLFDLYATIDKFYNFELSEKTKYLDRLYELDNDILNYIIHGVGNLSTLADKYNLTGERVRQHKDKVVERLREYFENKKVLKKEL